MTAAALLAAGGTAYLVRSSGGSVYSAQQLPGAQVRFEVETASGSALQIAWDIGPAHIGRKLGEPKGEPFPTPWSTTVTVDDDQFLELAHIGAISSDTDKVTCRIFIEGDLVSEDAADRAAICNLGIEKLKELFG
ncbi:hypothetical protein ACIBSW_25145 [Actinoplanes sp. NPDC049668]|uniref:hypothetical protein n=1 Tax=Actinoplanes sp. NPDC049668 TaxID=3363904 RepID=UPI003787DD7E